MKHTYNPHQARDEERFNGLLDELEDVHVKYRAFLKSTIDACIKDRIFITLHALECIMETMEEQLADEADNILSEIEQFDSSYHASPKNSEALIVEAHEELINSFLPKKFDLNKEFQEIITPKISPSFELAKHSYLNESAYLQMVRAVQIMTRGVK